MTRRTFFRRGARDRPLIDEEARPNDRAVYDERRDRGVRDEPRGRATRDDTGPPARRTHADDAYVDDAPMARDEAGSPVRRTRADDAYAGDARVARDGAGPPARRAYPDDAYADDAPVARDAAGPPAGRRYADDAYADSAPAARESVTEQRQTAMHARSLRGMLDGLVMLALLALEALLTVRFALIAFGANPSGSFTNFILDISSPIVRPFRDTFALHPWDRGVLDYNILLAMGVWFVAGILLMLAINAVVPDTTDDYRMDRRRRVTHG